MENTEDISYKWTGRLSGAVFRIVFIAVLATLPQLWRADSPKLDLSNCTEKRFTLTAYYSPLAGQSFFYKWNYADEVVLNGQWTHGASGRQVFNGMLAAPSSYAFGTQIYFKERGIGQVEDRWGAIVHAGEKWQKNDRIDVRVWKWEEWLKRALSFGVQTATGYICETPVWKAGLDWSVFPSYPNFFESTLRIMQLREGREDPWVEVLQRVLQKLWYLKASQVSGRYDIATKQAVCTYQKKHLKMSGNDFWCGYFGPDTRAAMHRHLNKLADPTLPAKKEKKEKTTTVTKSSNDELQAVLSPQEVLNKKALEEWDVQAYRFLVVIAPNEEGKHVKFLQRKLQRLWWYTSDVTGIYDDATRAAVYEFQRAYNILGKDAATDLQGYFGPSTRDMLNSLK